MIAVDDAIVEQALHAGFTDFEDALQYFAHSAHAAPG
jgi:hypothetical protein